MFLRLRDLRQRIVDNHGYSTGQYGVAATFWTRILEMPGQNLGWTPELKSDVSRSFPQPFHAIPGLNSIVPQPIFSQILSSLSLIINVPFITVKPSMLIASLNFNRPGQTSLETLPTE